MKWLGEQWTALSRRRRRHAAVAATVLAVVAGIHKAGWGPFADGDYFPQQGLGAAILNRTGWQMLHLALELLILATIISLCCHMLDGRHVISIGRDGLRFEDPEAETERITEDVATIDRLLEIIQSQDHHIDDMDRKLAAVMDSQADLRGKPEYAVVHDSHGGPAGDA